MNIKQIKNKYNLVGILTITYDGSGDSGSIEEMSIEPERDLTDADEDLANFTYEYLSKRHGGWEINDGANGTLTINFDKNTIEIEHNEVLREYDTTTHSEKF